MLNRIKSFVADLLANRRIRSAYNGLSRIVAKVGSINRLTSLAYHVPAAPTFSREQYAVLKGRAQYFDNLSINTTTKIHLRRNIHRLEKGMVMRPRRDVFAIQYIEETVDFFEQAARDQQDGSTSVDSDELRWAQDVLDQYFSVVRLGDTLGNLRDRFEELRLQLDAEESPKAKKIPYKRSASRELSVSYEQLEDLSMRRRSVRWFQQTPVPRELIDQALLVARQSPTACNRLPYEFRIFDDPDMVSTVANVPFGAAGYADNIPSIAVLIGRLDSYFSPRDRHVIYIDGSLAAMSFMFALETLGLASSVINWPDFEPLEIKMQKTLGLKPYERVIMLIAFGYADPEGMVAYSQKKELDTLRSYNVLADGVSGNASKQ